MADDPSRWSHSTGESQEFRDRHATSTRSSGYSGVEENADIGFTGNATDLGLALSSGRAAKQRRREGTNMQPGEDEEAEWQQGREMSQEELGQQEEENRHQEPELKEKGQGEEQGQEMDRETQEKE